MPDRRAFITSSATLAAAALLPGVARGAPLAPFKLYDTHAHFHGTDLARYPFRVDIDPVRRERALAQPVTPEILFKAWDDAGVEMGCGVQFNTTYATDNAYLLDVAEQYPGRVAPVVILSPTDPATPASLKSMAKAYGIVGVRFSGLPDAEGRFAFLGEDAQRSWGTANDLGLVVVLMPLGSPPQPSALPAAMKRIGALADRYPRLNIVLDHFGFPVAERDADVRVQPRSPGAGGAQERASQIFDVPARAAAARRRPGQGVPELRHRSLRHRQHCLGFGFRQHAGRPRRLREARARFRREPDAGPEAGDLLRQRQAIVRLRRPAPRPRGAHERHSPPARFGHAGARIVAMLDDDYRTTRRREWDEAGKRYGTLSRRPLGRSDAAGHRSDPRERGDLARATDPSTWGRVREARRSRPPSAWGPGGKVVGIDSAPSMIAAARRRAREARRRECRVPRNGGGKPGLPRQFVRRDHLAIRLSALHRCRAGLEGIPSGAASGRAARRRDARCGGAESLFHPHPCWR